MNARPNPFGSIIGKPLGGLIGGAVQHAEHEMITRAALGCHANQSVVNCFQPQSLDELAGAKGTLGAVASPDVNEICDSRAHCDDADYFNIQGYPQSRSAATAKLQECIDHHKMRFKQGLDSAAKMLDKNGNLDPDQSGIAIGGCIFVLDTVCLIEECGLAVLTSGGEALVECCYGAIRSCAIPITAGNGKCDAIGGFGRALHGYQDFYSHSNWVDAGVSPTSVVNPPGLNQVDIPAFLSYSFKQSLSSVLDPDFSTGCFFLGSDSTPGSFDCKDRVTHNTLFKDEGDIDPYWGKSIR